MRRIACWILIVVSSAAADQVSDAMRLLKSRDTNQRIAGAQRVRVLGPNAKKAASLLVKCTADKSYELRREASKALIAIGNAGAKRILRALKSSKNVQQRRILAQVVAKIGFDMASHSRALVALLDDPDEEVRLALAEALSKMSPTSPPELIQALGAKSPEARDAAAIALGRMGVAAVLSLKDALGDKHALVRAGAAAALGTVGEKARSTSAAIDALLKDEDAGVRAAAATAIGGIRGNTSHFVPKLIAMFGDPDANVRAAASTAVPRFGKEAAPALVKALALPSAAYAGAALRLLGPLAAADLEDGCDSTSSAIRAQSARLLAAVSGDVKSASGRIAPLLEDADAQVRRAAAEALATRGASFAADALMLAAADTDASVRAAAMRALTQVEITKSVGALLDKARKDTSLEVRIAAEAAQWSLGKSSRLLELARANLGSGDARTRAAACAALGDMGRGAEAALPELIAALEARPSPELVNALGAITAAHGNGLIGRAARYKKAPAATKAAIEGALDWLARHQDSKKSGVNDADGRWHSEKFVNHHKAGVMTGPGFPLYSGGVTGLAVSLYLAIGRADDPVAREGLEFLLRSQDPNGILANTRSQHYLIAHAFATIAMCEAWILTGEPRYRRAAVRAVRACEAARNPDLGWRYEPRGGENDTNVTAAILSALAMAERGGIAVDPAAFEGGARWILQVTDEEYGQIGYNIKGGSPARPAGLQDTFLPEDSQAMTAAGLWGLSLSARYSEASPGILKKCYGLCAELPPLWSGSRRDFYFWYYGTLVMHGRPGKGWTSWNKALTKALIDNQRSDDPAFSGSWDPVGVWGGDGGRIYSTAICALALATPYRMSADFLSGKPSGEYAKAAKALTKAARNPDPDISSRAAQWLRRIGG